MNIDQSTQGFNQMEVSMRSAIDDIDANQSQFDRIMNQLGPVRDLSSRYWGVTSDFIRRRPIETTIGFISLGIIIGVLARPRGPKLVNTTRNY